jgi:hypothetical protein
MKETIKEKLEDKGLFDLKRFNYLLKRSNKRKTKARVYARAKRQQIANMALKSTP